MPNRKTPVSSSTISTVLAALVPRTIFSAGSNTKGIKVIAGSCAEWQSSGGTFGHFVISTTPPSTMSDGATVSKVVSVQNASPNFMSYQIVDDLFVPSGYGLYWISTATSVQGTTTDVSWADA